MVKTTEKEKFYISIVALLVLAALITVIVAAFTPTDKGAKFHQQRFIK